MENKERKPILNYEIIDAEDIVDFTLREIIFEEICKKYDCNLKRFHKEHIMYGINNGMIKNDYQVKTGVLYAFMLPFEYENLSHKQIKFIRDVYKRYLSIPYRHDLNNYITEKRQSKLN